MACCENESFLRAHMAALSHDLNRVASEQDQITIPFAPIDYLKKLIEEVDAVFKSEPVLLKLNGPLVIVGDLHGHILDLYRIFQKFELPPYTSYLFLGDLVDRGEFSIETLSFIYVLKVLFPKNIYLIRGNHEFRSTTIDGGLLVESKKLYPRTKVFEEITRSFENIPLAALINEKILCLHGGLSPSFSSLSQLEEIERPIPNFNDPLVCGILWSDPSEKVDAFLPSQRGTGFLYGKNAVEKFLCHNNLTCIIRGHECVKEGILSKFDDHVFTVFSASNYCGVTNNKAAVLTISISCEMRFDFFPPFQYLKRNKVKYMNPSDPPSSMILLRTVPSRSVAMRGSDNLRWASMSAINTARSADVLAKSARKGQPLTICSSIDSIKRITRRRRMVDLTKPLPSLLTDGELRE
ncbi:Ser/Thr protein phosphatase [Tritrichomonas foetus]|uniref:Serine/threonine-protein phosphatase n=1 Tax=Tritrichomonas foetus TaxID=1144522 RepID=A0A1J4J910_9EUKA|nr:Ser/Thr protein phosphatase [Tritrichomonas foetus]|eukprot:OHS95632.1 Ser/Thr protein phosphatase [Tritrichomonas foetus]